MDRHVVQIRARCFPDRGGEEAIRGEAQEGFGGCFVGWFLLGSLTAREFHCTSHVSKACDDLVADVVDEELPMHASIEPFVFFESSHETSRSLRDVAYHY